MIREQGLLQQGVPLQPKQTIRVLNRVSVQTPTVSVENFLEWFAEVRQVTSLLTEKGLGGPHLVGTW